MKKAKWQSIGPQTQHKLLISWELLLLTGQHNVRGEDFDLPTHFHTYCFHNFWAWIS